MATTSTPALSSPGIGSGLDIAGMVSKLAAVERLPVQKLQLRATTINSQMTEIGSLQSLVSTFSDAASKLADTSNWNPLSPSSTNSAAVNVTASATAAPASMVVSVSKLAQGQAVASSAVVASSAMGTGSLTIALGTWSGTSFSPAAASPVTVAIGAGQDTLSQIVAKINAANAGVTASILSDASGDRLVVRSNGIGAVSGFRIQVADDDTTPNDAAGLSRLAYDPAVNGLGMALNQTAQNAEAKINGVTVSTATNTLTSAATGIDVNFLQVTSTDVTVGVSQNINTLTGYVQSLVNAYNAVNTLIHNDTAYNADTKIGGVLQGDPTVRGLQSALRSILSSNVQGSTLTSLSKAGVQFQSDGSLKLDTTKLKAALATVSDVKNLFTKSDGVPTSQGIAVRLKAFATGALAVTGTFASKSASYKTALKLNSAEQARVNARADSLQAALLKQYNALDNQVAQLNALNSYVTQQITTWNKNTSN